MLPISRNCARLGAYLGQIGRDLRVLRVHLHIDLPPRPTAGEGAMATNHPELPAPLVSPLRHPVKWLGLTSLSVIAAVVFAHIGALDITGLYYALFEWNAHMTAWWHSFISDDNLRHSVRDVAEGFYGGAIAQLLVWNAFKKHRVKYMAKPMNRIDQIEELLRIPNLRSKRELSFWQIPYALLLWAPLYGSIGFAVAYLLDAAILHDVAILQHTVTALSPHASLWQRARSIDTSNWDKKVMGFAALGGTPRAGDPCAGTTRRPSEPAATTSAHRCGPAPSSRPAGTAPCRRCCC